MRPSDVLHTRHRRNRGRQAVRSGHAGDYQLALSATRDAQERASAREFAAKVRAREAAELEAAADVLNRGKR